jgi:hypothetical protein
MPVYPSHGRPYPQAPRPDELPEGTPRTPDPRARATAERPAGSPRATSRLASVARRPPARAAWPAASHSPTGPTLRSTSEPRCRSVGPSVRRSRPASAVATAVLARRAWSPPPRFSSCGRVTSATRRHRRAMRRWRSRLADASRNNLLSAHELCAREASARPRAPVDPARTMDAAESARDGDAT